MVNPGDYVRVRTVKEELKAIFLESHEPEIILLKLDSGYNIGMPKEDIVDIKVLKRHKETREKRKLKEKKKLPKIDMIITGGTISSHLDSSTGAVKWLASPEELFKFYPEIFDIVNVQKIKTPFMKASENMDFKDWQEIAKAVEESLNDKEVEGVIVTHGTDFLHYTSAALSFFLQNLNKPVVLTYSQRSSDRASSDAALNLVCSARAAISDIAEVMLVGHGSSSDDFCYALPGAKTRKMHTSKRNAFKVINAKPLAKIYTDRVEGISGYNHRDNKKKIKLDINFSDCIALVKFYPGMDPDFIEYLGQKYDGIVIEAAGLGHLASREARKNLLPKLKKAIDNGLIVCVAPQTIYGRLDPLVYSPGRDLIKAGVIFLEDMLPETAYVKLGWVLGHSQWKSREKIKEKMLENISGELNDRLEE